MPQGVDKSTTIISQEEKEKAFYAKPSYQKILIAFAGPFFNLLLAIGLFWAVYTIGKPEPAYQTKSVIVGYVSNDSWAKSILKPGDKILSINNKPIKDWQSFYKAFVENIGKTVSLDVLRDNKVLRFSVKLPSLVNSIGIGPSLPPILGGVLKGYPAYQIGLKEGDRILAINGQKVEEWYQIEEILKNQEPASLPQSIKITYEENNKIFTKSLIPVYDKTLKRYVIGIAPKEEQIIVKYSPTKAFVKALDTTKNITKITFDSIVSMITLKSSIRNIGGPITIARMSSKAAQSGFSDFLFFMGFISLQLFIMNLMPLPVLDGGLIVLFTIELLLRKPLSLKFKENWQKIGIALVGSLSIFAIINDILRIIK